MINAINLRHCIKCVYGKSKGYATIGSYRMWLKFEEYVSTIFHDFARITSRSDIKATWQERVKLSPLYMLYEKYIFPSL